MTTIAFQKSAAFWWLVFCVFFSFSIFVLLFLCPFLPLFWFDRRLLCFFSRKMSELFSADWRSRPCFCPKTIPLSPIDCLSFENTLTGGPSFQMLFFTQCNRKIAASTKQKKKDFDILFSFSPGVYGGVAHLKAAKKVRKKSKKPNVKCHQSSQIIFFFSLEVNFVTPRLSKMSRHNHGFFFFVCGKSWCLTFAPGQKSKKKRENTVISFH